MIRTLTSMEIRWVGAALSAFFPSADRGSLPVGIESLDVGAHFRQVFALAPLEPVLGLRLAIWLVALAPIFVLRRARTIAGLSHADREKVMTALLASPIYAVRQLVIALKAIGALLYCAAPEVRDAVVKVRSGASLVRLHARAIDTSEKTLTAQGAVHEHAR